MLLLVVLLWCPWPPRVSLIGQLLGERSFVPHGCVETFDGHRARLALRLDVLTSTRPRAIAIKPMRTICAVSDPVKASAPDGVADTVDSSPVGLLDVASAD